jgi:spermidine synthase
VWGRPASLSLAYSGFQYSSYLRRCFSRLPHWSWRDLILFLAQLKSVCVNLLRRKPFVYRRRGTVSLHFNLWATQSEMRCHAPDELIVPYTRTMMGFLLFKPRPQRIVMIGLGGGSLAKYCHAKLPEASIVVAEINREVIALRDLFRIPPDEERFEVLCEDGAALVGKLSNCVDVLLVDGFDLHGQPAQLCTQRFYEDCYRSLAPEGLIVINLSIDDPNLEQSHARLRRSFANAVLVDSPDGTNKVAFAGKGAGFDLPLEKLRARLAKLERLHPVGLRETFERIRFRQSLSRSTSARRKLAEARDERAQLP